jgi:hypothetical protein
MVLRQPFFLASGKAVQKDDRKLFAKGGSSRGY